MRVSDRGTKKWVSLMLPEHVDMLKKVFVEHKEKPILDDQQRAEIDQKLTEALKTKADIELTYFADNEIQTVIGKLTRIDDLHSCLYLVSHSRWKITLTDIVNVEIYSI